MLDERRKDLSRQEEEKSAYEEAVEERNNTVDEGEDEYGGRDEDSSTRD